jgi:hypothetical protein
MKAHWVRPGSMSQPDVEFFEAADHMASVGIKQTIVDHHKHDHNSTAC